MRYPARRLETGQCRFREAFLFLPKTINGETRWLEYVAWWEMFESTYANYDVIFDSNKWKPLKWGLVGHTPRYWKWVERFTTKHTVAP